MDANNLNMAFWVAFLIGRFSGSWIATKVKPQVLILIYYLGSIAGVSIIIGLDMTHNDSAPFLYMAVSLFGYFVSVWLQLDIPPAEAI